MDKDCVLYLLMDMWVNGVLDRILEKDADYQEIIRKSNDYSVRLDAMDLPAETRSLIDEYICEQNALGARYGALAYLFLLISIHTDALQRLPGAAVRADLRFAVRP